MSLSYKNLFVVFFNLFVFLFSSIIYIKFKIGSYLVFSIIICIYVSYTILYWKYYFEILICFFLFLGFWLKTSFHFIFNHPYQFSETSTHNYVFAIKDNFLDLFENLCFFFIIFITVIYLIKKINFRINFMNNITLSDYLFSKKYFNIILYLIAITLVFLNFQYSFAFRGQFSENIYFEKIFKYLLTILLPFIFLLNLDYVFKKNKNLLAYLIPIFIFFIISYHSLNSRLSIIIIVNILFTIFVFYKKNFFSLFKNVKVFYVLILIVVIFSSLISTSIVSSKRSNNIYSLKAFFNQILYLSSQRWVGIDAAANIIYTDEKRGLSFFLDSITDKKNSLKKDFYIINYYQKKKESDIKSVDAKFNNVFTPGFVSYYLINNSYVIITFLISLTLLFLIFCEQFFYTLLGKNYMAICFLQFLIVWRFIHIGLYPINTLVYFILIILLPTSLFFINKVFKYLNK